MLGLGHAILTFRIKKSIINDAGDYKGCRKANFDVRSK